jgi:myo-inositol 2-dehydrogenase/D-chiro-inositol 1-dehydrogenase
MADIRYGIIGSGMMGQEHIRTIGLLEGARVTAVADPDEGMRSSAAHMAGKDCAEFTDHAALLQSGSCDALVIAAPNHLHHRILKDVLPADLPILVEKPLCTTLADCEEILDLARGRTSQVWVAMEYRYIPPVQRLIEVVHAGETGVPRMISIREHRFPFLKKVGDWNRFEAKTGGTLVEKCCHFFDLMRLIARAEPVRVYASGMRTSISATRTMMAAARTFSTTPSWWSISTMACAPCWICACLPKAPTGRRRSR